MAKGKNKKKQNGKDNGSAANGTEKKPEQPEIQPDTPVEEDSIPSQSEELVKEDLKQEPETNTIEEEASEVSTDPVSTSHSDEKDKLIESLQQQLKAKDEKIALLESNDVAAELEKKVQECEKYQSSYQALLSRLSSMKSVFQKMKESEIELENTQSELASCKETVEQLQKDIVAKDKAIEDLNTSVKSLKEEAEGLNRECDKLSKDYTLLKKNTELKEDEQVLEIKRLETSNRKHNLEIKELKSEIEEYLIIVNEEKISKQNLFHEVNEVKARNEALVLDNENLQKDSDGLRSTVNSLESKIAELTSAFEGEKHNLQHQIEVNITKASEIEAQLQTANAKLADADQKLTRMSDLENELKQKQLTIGKLRHETIVLNEHLMKAMKLVKKESTTETVDRELISNLLISFLQLPRADAKKFEVLQLISNFLNWDDEKKRHAGLMSSNSKTNSSSILNVPTTPIAENTSQRSGQSFVSLWTEFLEKESTPNNK
ncbi:hypothetical protein OGAPHI_003421 [Ogataea philodendri]|uniref:GRIP domain-containing protein n=1 Tax=Ogataea philodendri TaxID=1378263 RepID=A0A9P8P8B9_9ASCO|nr:uncharacterized protein OGAPHI_003421 [Ogataea philodendri]KAH3666971.1 hypothetical protein OGAPHI_003421 [Ogataea philodendri]